MFRWSGLPQSLKPKQFALLGPRRSRGQAPPIRWYLPYNTASHTGRLQSSSTRRENLRLSSMLHTTIPILRSHWRDMTTNKCEHVLEVYENNVLWVTFGNTRHITTPCMICTCHQYC
jgi:hypothetical protein